MVMCQGEILLSELVADECILGQNPKRSQFLRLFQPGEILDCGFREKMVMEGILVRCDVDDNLQRGIRIQCDDDGNLHVTNTTW